MRNSKARSETEVLNDVGDGPDAGAKKTPDINALLANAETTLVSIDYIDLDDETFCFRDGVAPCEPDTFIDDYGVFDASDGHAIILLQDGDDAELRVLNGRRRLIGLRDHTDVIQVRCKVVTAVTAEVATILAAQANLNHGQPLTLAEKRRCFLAEHQALLDGGYETPSMREFARRYHVANATPGNWLKSVQGNAGDGVDDQPRAEFRVKLFDSSNFLDNDDVIMAPRPSDGVQNEHLDPDEATRIAELNSTAGPSAGVQNEHLKLIGRIEAGGASCRNAKTFTPAIAPVSVAEALMSLTVSVEMIESLEPHRLTLQIEDFRDLHQRLGDALQSCASVKEDVA